jgi:hypothetical protein
MGNFPNLSQLFGEQSMLAPQLGLDQFNQAQNGEMLDQAKGLQDMFLNHEMNPLKVQQRQLENEQIPVETQGKMLNNQATELSNLFTRQTQDGKITATNAENAIKPQEMAQKKAMLQAEEWLRSPDPKVRQLGMDIIEHSKSVVEKKFEQDNQGRNQINAINATGAQQRELENLRIGAGKYNKSKTSGAAQSLQDALASGKLNYEKADTLISNHLAMLGLRLQSAETVEEAQDIQRELAYWTPIGQQYAQKVIDAKGAAGAQPRAGGVELGAATNLPTVPSRPAPALNVPGAASAPSSAASAADPYAGWSMQQWKQRYPGRSDEEIRRALSTKGYNPK